MRLRALAVYLAGCGRIGFGLEGTRSDGAPPMGDAPPDEVVVDTCTTLTESCAFPPSPQACSCWGTVIANSANVTANNGLVIVPFTDESSRGGCRRTAVPFTGAGIFASVDGVFDEASSVTTLEVGPYQIKVTGGATSIGAVASGQSLALVPYDASSMRWWRIRPDGAGIRFETSPDAMTWTRLASTDMAADASYTVALFAENLDAEPGMTAALFGRINACAN